MTSKNALPIVAVDIPAVIEFRIKKQPRGYRGQVILHNHDGSGSVVFTATGAKTPVFTWMQTQWQTMHALYRGEQVPEFKQSFPWEGEDETPFHFWPEV